MAKRTSTQESIVLAFELLKRIPRYQKVTASQLRDQLDAIGIRRDIRTIQRNLEMLSEHFQIDRDERTKPYGYSWDKQAKGLTMPNLSAHEALLLLMAEAHLKNLLPSEVMTSLDGFFTEAKRQLMPMSESVRERDWLDKVRVVSDTQPLLAPKIDNSVFQSVSEALFQDRLLQIEYRNARQQLRQALVMPLGLAQQGPRLYLVCRFDGFENERSLAVHRIVKATVSSFNFERPASFQLSKYDADDRFGFGEGQLCQLKFNIAKTAGYHLLETPLAEDQTVVENEDYYVISATVINSLRLTRWLNSFGNDVWGIRYLE